MSNLTASVSASNFVSASVRAELDGELGLSVHEIALSLNRRFQEIKELVEVNMEFLDQVEISTFYNSNGLEVQSYILSVDDAKYIVARSNTTEGKHYTKFLIQQENKLETMLSDPDTAVKVFQKLADQKRELASVTAIAAYSQKALTSSQQNNATQTRKVHALEAELMQLNRMVSVSQWLIIRRHKMSGVEARFLTRDVREMVTSQGHLPIKQVVGTDKYESWTFKLSWLDENTDRIAAIAADIASKNARKPGGFKLKQA